MKFLGFLFDPDSKFGRIMQQIVTLVISNLLFLLFSIPIFTIGASYTALCEVMLLSEEEQKDTSLVLCFWNSFKKNFKRATGAWGIYILCVIIGYADLLFCEGKSGMLVYFAYMICFLLLFATILFLYVFPILLLFPDKIKNSIRNAFYLAMKKPVIALLIGACNIIPIACMFLDQRNQPTYVICFFFFGFALVTKISMWLLKKGIYK